MNCPQCSTDAVTFFEMAALVVFVAGIASAWVVREMKREIARITLPRRMAAYERHLALAEKAQSHVVVYEATGQFPDDTADLALSLREAGNAVRYEGDPRYAEKADLAVALLEAFKRGSD